MPLPRPNIDTDQIIPARFLSRPREVDHTEFLFHDARRLPDGANVATFGGWQDLYLRTSAPPFPAGPTPSTA